MIFFFFFLISFAMAPQAPLLWAMYADTADYSEWKNNRRATGLVFSAATFSQKFGMAIGGGLAGWLLSIFHFIPNVAQSAETLNGIRLMMSYIPAVGTLIATIAALFYPLDDDTMAEIEDELQAKQETRQRRLVDHLPHISANFGCLLEGCIWFECLYLITEFAKMRPQ